MPAADYTDANLPGTTVDKLNVLGSGLALAITLALLNSVCAISVNLWPQQAIAFANTWAHGLDLKPLMADSSLTVARFTYGLIGLAGRFPVRGGLRVTVQSVARRWPPRAVSPMHTTLGNTPSRSAWLTVGLMVAFIAAFCFLREHWGHVLGAWPYLLLLACPLIDLVMHRGRGGGRHGH